MCVSDRYPAYREAFKRLLPEKIHLRVEDFADDISNNLIEAFNGQLKPGTRPKGALNL